LITPRQKEAAVELAKILDIPHGYILQALVMIEKKSAYWIRKIPKESGGERQIQKALRPLNIIQARIADLLYPYTISEKPENNINHSFVAGRSHRTAILPHLQANAFFSFDIKDAFPSTRRKQVFFTLRMIKFPEIGFSEEVADLMAELICYTPSGKPEDGFLPLGYTSSPCVFNLILRRTDDVLAGFAQKRGYQVSRYVDNFAISTTEERIPEIERKDAIRIVESLGRYNIPEEKTAYWEARKGKVHFEFLKLVIEETKEGERVINVADERLGKILWAILGALEEKDYSKDTFASIRGKISYLKSIYRRQGLPLPEEISEPFAKLKAMREGQLQNRLV